MSRVRPGRVTKVKAVGADAFNVAVPSTHIGAFLQAGIVRREAITFTSGANVLTGCNTT